MKKITVEECIALVSSVLGVEEANSYSKHIAGLQDVTVAVSSSGVICVLYTDDGGNSSDFEIHLIAKKIYVDVDGTLLNGSLDSKFKTMVSEVGFEKTLSWYNDCNVNDLSVNMELINELITLKEFGYVLVLWTNRGECQKKMTKENLGVYWNMFDSHEFHDGKKGKCVLDGMVYDNESKYLACGVMGKLISF